MRAIAIALMITSLSAHAGVIGMAISDAGSVYLHDEARACVGGAWYAQWRAVDGSTVDGCWKAGPDGVVRVAFMDADVAMIPFDAIKQPQGL